MTPTLSNTALGQGNKALFADLLTLARAAEPHILARTRTLVEMESPSHDKAAVDRVTSVVATWCRDSGGEVILHPHQTFGDSLEARFGAPSAKQPPVLLLGHLDTVWDTGTLAGMPWVQDDERIAGPGVLDMKAGVVMALTAFDILRAARQDIPACVLLLHADEEVGSPESRALTERVASGCSRVYVLEPGQGLKGALKTARKGVGLFRLDVHGVAAHAGVAFTDGHSAILELARQLAAVAAFSDERRGITVNPGVIGGGTRSNVVAEHAWAEIDVRVRSEADGLKLHEKLHALQPHDPACTLTVTGALNRPPMVRTEAISALFQRAAATAAVMGIGALGEAATGGGSDGNFTAALGIPTLDGMGAVGAGAHAPHEYVLRRELAPRTALLAAMLLDAGR